MLQGKKSKVVTAPPDPSSNHNSSVLDAVLNESRHASNAGRPVTWATFVVEQTNPLRLECNKAATIAPSCIVKPDLMDTVLCAIPAGFDPVIIAVLSRNQPEASLHIESGVPIEMSTPAFSLSSGTVELTAERVECTVGLMRRVAERVDDLVTYLSSSVGTAFLMAKRSIKRVEELDETSAGHLKLEGSALLEMNGEVTAVSGEQLIKMQSKQIHMG